MKTNPKICVVGLGYVGGPLSDALSEHYEVIGYDKKFGTSPDVMEGADIIICCLPTPITTYNKPDLSCLETFVEEVSFYVEKDTIIIFESTVAPGTTDTLMERVKDLSGEIYLRYGYSPERINPGDMVHTLENTTKLIAGSDEDITEYIFNVYSKVCKNLHKCPSIKVAEAAKIIENTQRDLNIALINEFALIMAADNIDTLDVLEAASTKWNFVNVKPGLVGGHCIGVDPYYLAQYSLDMDITPQLILSGRDTNECMMDVIIDAIIEIDKYVPNATVHFEGLTFKGNCDDTRNSKTIELIDTLKKLRKGDITSYDAMIEGGIQPLKETDILVLTVNHTYIEHWYKHVKCKAIVDLHGIVDRIWAEENDVILWRP